ncbi:hypothetical protein BWQ96_01026 [Gracilariopsis chorda]|uniref:Uncharacterized protein n=1 Tax=Gracilariopsis chorda TaxID=448386 RepID=A0A2V3J5G0_9FLOR|nr:hypothetical protein BWQ96_01026 [Gracilariopsis chorda]|eukprot:PXF49237.1 hypothetical protein BWQ96_01026 [Gracilariopsis chorda]
MRTRSSRLRMFTDAIAANIMPAYEAEQLLHQAPAQDSRPGARRRTTSASDTQSNPFESTPSPLSYNRHVPPPQFELHSPSSNAPSSDVMMRNIVMGTALLVAMLMFMHAAVYVAIFVVGVLTPAWRTFKCMEGRPDSDVLVQLVDDDDYDDQVIDVDNMHLRHENGQQTMHNWHAYWVLFALLFTTDSLLIRLILPTILPTTLYNTILFALLSWMTRNKAANSAFVYGAFVRPTLLKVENFVDDAAAKAMFHMDRASQQLVLGVHEVITPLVKQLEQAATSTAAQMQQHHQIDRPRRRHSSRNQR